MKSNLTKSLLCYFVGYMFIGSLLVSILPEKYYIIGQLLISFITFITVIYCSKEYFKSHFLNDMQECLDKSIRLGIYTFIVVMISITFSSLTRNIGLNNSTANNNFIISLAINSPISVGVMTILFLPVIEELIFKYQLVDNTTFLKQHTLIKFIAIGTLFAGLHCINEILTLNITVIISFVNYLVFYLFTSYIFKKYNNLMMAITIHCLYNAVSFILIFS